MFVFTFDEEALDEVSFCLGEILGPPAKALFGFLDCGMMCDSLDWRVK